MTTGIKGSKTIHTLEDCIRDIGEIPFCQCGCGNKVNIDPKYYLRYKKLGYPKFIRGHKTHGISWKLSEENKIKRIGKCGKYIRTDEIKNKTRGIVKSEITKQKMKENHADMSGDKNPCWRGGLTPIFQLIRNSPKYSEWRFSVFKRDSFICQDCNTENVWLEAHHKDKFVDILRRNNILSLEQSYLCDELWNLDNGITLCEKCHNKTKGWNKYVKR